MKKRAWKEKLERLVKNLTEGIVVAFTGAAGSEQVAQARRAPIEHTAEIFECITDAPLFVLDKEWRFSYLNRRAEQVFQKSKEDLPGKSIWGELPETTDSRFFTEYHRAVENKTLAIFEEFYPPLGRWFEVHAYPYQDGLLIFHYDVTEKKRAKELSDALNDINMTINSTLEFDEIMQRVVVKSAKAIGCETAAITLREGDYWVLRYNYGFSNELIGTRFTDEEAKHTVLAADTRKTIVIDDAFKDERINCEVAKALSIRSILIVPLTVRMEDVIGVLSFNYHSSPVIFTEAQVGFANNVAVSVSLALENARLYTKERHIADTLQEALLVVPEKIEGIGFSYLYRSATEAAMVGGDFYDVFELEHDRVGIVVGDISGKGLGAAALTSLVKHTLKAYAFQRYSPAVIMAKTNELVEKALATGTFVTVFFGILDTRSGALTYCSAGHPPAILRKRTGQISLLNTSSPFVGALTGLNYMDDDEPLEEGDILVLYTDGVTEARREDECFGEERLVDCVRDCPPAPKEIPQRIFSEVMDFTDGRLSDDVALLAVLFEHRVHA
ncbi:MAG: SpoIIE family protein phosphatase [Actinobacteria bacterium]|nr:SpoIIE family protein phosphatase [Actinomycetota bacterium]